jgi:hypothetical protein
MLRLRGNGMHRLSCRGRKGNGKRKTEESLPARFSTPMMKPLLLFALLPQPAREKYKTKPI